MSGSTNTPRTRLAKKRIAAIARRLRKVYVESTGMSGGLVEWGREARALLLIAQGFHARDAERTAYGDD